MNARRFYSLLRPAKRLGSAKTKPAQPQVPARTRFAPSPTGFLHLGSLRTALYNYLLAKSTGGQFLLRLEDTDQKRLVEGAEKSLYESLKWCGLKWDEGPLVGGPYGPYRQSDRTEIYAEHIKRLLENGNAYRCFCPKERLNSLRESAQKLSPPTTVTYDRECASIPLDLSNKRAETEEFTIRFKSPITYPKFLDLLHGELDLQPQINRDDVRYDDQVLIKSDGLPTYHFANVVDDHLMKITHVVRGEEWLPSTPKHIALYKAFGWNAPSFIHIPLLTGSKDKKLSKRSGDTNVSNFAEKGILPEALINFVALFGWSIPKSANLKSEILTLGELEKFFNINELTKGNAKIDDKKLLFFNKHFLSQRIDKDDPEIIDQAVDIIGGDVSRKQVIKLLRLVKNHIATVLEVSEYKYLLSPLDLEENQGIQKYLASELPQLRTTIDILGKFQSQEAFQSFDQIMDSICEEFPKKEVFGALRVALTGGKPGLKIPAIVEFLGIDESAKRVADTLVVTTEELANRAKLE